MRKGICSALMIICLMLTACGSTKEKQLESVCMRFTESEDVRMTAQVQADFGETVEKYTLEYGFDGETWTVLVTEPAFVAGITARITKDALELEYDGAILTTGSLLENGVAPISAVPMLHEALRMGTTDSIWTEGELLAGSFVYDDAISVSVWFDRNGNPAACQLMENNIVKASCLFSNVEIKEMKHGTTEETDLGRDQSAQSGE